MHLAPDENIYRRVSYLCKGCKITRSVIVDQSIHLEREELKENGLASYIDIHENIRIDASDEHGVKLFVDHNFQVRSNDLLQGRQELKQNLLGLPTPQMKLSKYKILTYTNSINSILLTSRQHNLEIYTISNNPSSDENNPIVINSPLGAIIIQVTFKTSNLTDLEQNSIIEWLKILTEWVESTANLNIKMMGSIINYIDKQGIVTPDVVDQLVLPIVLDSTSRLQLLNKDLIVERIMGNTAKIALTRGYFTPSKDVDYETMFLISDQFQNKGFVRIKKVVDNIYDNAIEKETALETFLILLFELMNEDLIKYKVSYLL
ncbi:MAG: hypothetical protein OEZ01_09040 [Candidatus Heimdallarchaeota archaeon]|nr:hypothetical protein [Candidatus Heimdallarchaeota archaeon]MDH5646139.1 hypothetical protein [Candidatus Heimdallarchaeota archaeon]